MKGDKSSPKARLNKLRRPQNRTQDGFLKACLGLVKQLQFKQPLNPIKKPRPVTEVLETYLGRLVRSRFLVFFLRRHPFEGDLDIVSCFDETERYFGRGRRNSEF